MESYLVYLIFLFSVLFLKCDSQEDGKDSTHIISNETTGHSIAEEFNETILMINNNNTLHINGTVFNQTTNEYSLKENVTNLTLTKMDSDEESNDKILTFPFEEQAAFFKYTGKILAKDVKDKFLTTSFDAYNMVFGTLENFLNFNISSLNVENLNQFNPFFNSFQKLFKKDYSEDEKEERSGILKRTIISIQKHNRDLQATFTKGINKLSDMKWTEISKQKLGLLVENSKESSTKDEDVMTKGTFFDNPIPDAWDWRKYGIVTEPRDQGKCGSCWSFAAASVLESHNMKRQIYEGTFDAKNKITVSEQNLIDCSEEFGNRGCNGGIPHYAIKYVNANKGIMSVEDYPYKENKGNCSYNQQKKVDVLVSHDQRIKPGDDDELARAIYNYGPVSSAVHVTEDLVMYKNGIFEDPKCKPESVNHAVVTVAYTKDYFVVRNSWGKDWGENGYIRISRKQTNTCGISQQSSYPVLPGAVETKDMTNKLKLVKIDK